MRFDAHCHLAAFPDETVIARARAAGVTGIHAPCASPADFAALPRLRELEGVRVGVGLHPWWVAAVDDAAVDAALERVCTLAGEGASSIGEIGLDGTPRFRASLERQARALDAQLALARRLALPAALHVVDAHGHMLALLERAGSLTGYVHGFSGAPEVAARYVALGLHLSFGPLVTRPSTRRAVEAARSAPEHRLLVETDAPDQKPHGRVLGEPAHLGDVLESVARIRGTTPEHVAAITRANALRLFDPSGRRAAPGPGC